MNPIKLFSKILDETTKEAVDNFINEVERSNEMSKVFFEAKEKVEQAKKNYGNFEENSKQPLAHNFFCAEDYESEPDESDRPPSPDPNLKTTYLIHRFSTKRGFIQNELRASPTYPSVRVSELIQKFDTNKIESESKLQINDTAKILNENTQKLKAKTSLQQEITPQNPIIHGTIVELGFESPPLTQSYAQTKVNHGSIEKLDSKFESSIPRKKNYNSGLKTLKTIFEDVEETDEVSKILSAELGFEGNTSNPNYFQNKRNIVNADQSESEEKKTSNCLERFSCTRLKDLNKKCSIS